MSPGANVTNPIPRPGILDIATYVGGESETPPGVGTPIKLSSNESALGPSPKAVAAYMAAGDRLHRYPDGAAAELRRALGRRWDLDPERIVCGNGSDEILAMLISAYAGPGDEVLYSEYGFLMYRISSLAAGATPVAAPETDYRCDADAILGRVGPRTRLVMLANPNNPTGTFLSRGEMQRLHAGLPRGVIFVIDAAYAEFVDDVGYDAGIELAEASENVVMTRTFSKLYGLAALRLGWCYGAPEIIDVLNRVRGPFNVTSPAQAAAVAALADGAHEDAARRHNERWRTWLAAKLTALGLFVVPGITNFVLARFDDGNRSAVAAGEFLKERGILVRGMEAYGLGDCLRISVGLEDENKAVAEALVEFLTARRKSA
jgi:histidinol-phosphate aminotransferase